MKLAGFADEVSVELDKQIEVTKTLGWNGIEMRSVDNKIHFDDVDEATFETMYGKLKDAGIEIVSYGSQIANWARKITGDFQLDLAELNRLIPRMHNTHTKIVRIMSYPNDDLSENAWKTEVFKRLSALCKIA